MNRRNDPDANDDKERDALKREQFEQDDPRVAEDYYEDED